ncbi:MAG: hypothetical protein AAF488_17825, partial [Planctomycetota bacterium]
MSDPKPDPVDQPNDSPELDPVAEPDLTVIIDESELQGLPGEPTELFADPAEEVLVVLPDEEEDLGEIDLLAHHPDAEVTESLDGSYPADATPEVEVEALPDLEHVEDITALLQDEAVELEAPSYTSSVRYDEGGGGRRLPWLSLAAAACFAAVGVLYGPKIWDQVASSNERPVAQAQPVDPTPVTDPDPTSASDPTADREAMREWFAGALAHNLGVDSVPSVEVDDPAVD